ncbi:MAG: hypothetical protein V3W44_09545 [Dehalococcoidales bacterium]
MTEPGFSLTDIFNQTDSAVEVCGLVITGHRWDNEGRQQGGMLPPPEIAGCRVRLKSMDGRTPIQYKAGFKRDLNVHRGYGKDRRGVEHHVDDIRYPCGEDAVEGECSLLEAWIVMMQRGEHCYVTADKVIMDSHWKFREIRDTPVPEKKKRGRPRKAPSASV